MAETIFNDIKIKSINYDGSVVVSGLATTSRLDRQDEQMIITPQALKEALPTFESNGSPMKVNHGADERFGNKIVGKVSSLMYLDEDKFDLSNAVQNKTQVQAIATIFDPEAVKLVLEGYLGSFSIGLKIRYTTDSNGDQIPCIYYIPGTKYEILTKIEILELTVCETPANPDCEFKIVQDMDIEAMLGEKIEAYGQKAKILEVAQKNGETYFKVDFVNTKLKSVFIKKDNNITMENKNISQELLDLLKQVVATSYAITVQAHGYHWNIQGEDFNEFHSFFGDIYTDQLEHTDGYAEHIRALGEFAPQGIEFLSEKSLVKESLVQTDVQSARAGLLASYETFSNLLTEVAQKAESENQLPLQNFLLDKIDGYAKLLWQLKASEETKTKSDIESNPIPQVNNQTTMEEELKPIVENEETQVSDTTVVETPAEELTSTDEIKEKAVNPDSQADDSDEEVGEEADDEVSEDEIEKSNSYKMDKLCKDMEELKSLVSSFVATQKGMGEMEDISKAKSGKDVSETEADKEVASKPEQVEEVKEKSILSAKTFGSYSAEESAKYFPAFIN